MLKVYLIVVVAGRVFSAEAPSPEQCVHGAEVVRQMLAPVPAKIACIPMPQPPTKTYDLFDWLRKGDA